MKRRDLHSKLTRANKIKAHEKALNAIKRKVDIILNSYEKKTIKQIVEVGKFVESYDRDWEQFTEKANNLKDESLVLIANVLQEKLKLKELRKENRRCRKIRKKKEEALKEKQQVKLDNLFAGKRELENKLKKENVERSNKIIEEKKLRDLELKKIEEFINGSS
jgi:hypothetical protein